MKTVVMNHIMPRIMQGLRSPYFFYGVLAFFVLETLWVIFSAAYPMAFDENFHLGIIKIYAQQWLPFLGDQPAGADAFGAVARDPSYLYHYLMSFPYRFIGLFTGNEATQVIWLRLLNLGMVVGGLVLFRRLFQRVRLSPALTNGALLLFVLIPIVPMLSGQVNYDNLLFLMLPALCLLVFRIQAALSRQRIDVGAVALFLTGSLLASLVKYPFLPLFAGAVIWLVVWGFLQFRHRPWKYAWQAARTSWAKVSRGAKIGLVVGFALAFGLFLQRYGVNMVRYGTPVPRCEKVLTVYQCSDYGPWARNYQLSQIKGDFNTSPRYYTGQWMYWMTHRLFFTVDGPATGFASRLPLPLPIKGFVIVVAVSAVALAFTWRRVYHRQPMLAFFSCMSLVYVVVLWLDEYAQYRYTGWAVAINGRYLLPIFLLLVPVAGRALSIASRRAPSALKLGAVACIIVLFLQGGGVLSYILRSEPSWYWPNSVVVKMNESARWWLSHGIVKGEKYYR